MGLGFYEILFLALAPFFLIVIPVIVAHRLGKRKGRLMEMERQIMDQAYKQQA